MASQATQPHEGQFTKKYCKHGTRLAWLLKMLFDAIKKNCNNDTSDAQLSCGW